MFIIATWLPLHFRPWAWWSSARTPSWESPGWRAAGPRGSSDHSSATIVQHKLCACLQIRNNVRFIIKVLASGVSSDHSFATKVQFKLCLCNLEHRNLFLILSFCLVTWAPCVFQSAIPDTNNTVRKACYGAPCHTITIQALFHGCNIVIYICHTNARLTNTVHVKWSILRNNVLLLLRGLVPYVRGRE